MKIKKWFGWLIPKRVKKLIAYIKDKISRSLRLQLMLTFAICLVAGMMVAGMTNPMFVSREASISYANGMEEIDDQAQTIIRELNNHRQDSNLTEAEAVNNVLNQYVSLNRLKILIVDLDGKVLYKSKNANETQVDLHGIIRNAMEDRFKNQTSEQEEFTSFYPLDLTTGKAYLIVSGMPRPQITYHEQDSPTSTLLGFAAFIVLFYYLTRPKMRFLKEVADGLLEISRGNLTHRVPNQRQDEFGLLGNSVNHMADEIQNRIEEERKAEKSKNELITNVSHDLRTPLTSIMGYLRLVTENRYSSGDELREYVQIAYNKSEKLQVLIEDLFEYTKLTNQGVRLNRQVVSFNELLGQVAEELVPQAEADGLAFVTEMPEENIMADLDGDKMARVLENLLGNALKYSYKPGEIKIRLWRQGEDLMVSIANRGEPIPQAVLPRLFERFYRADESRTDGSSGLGLAIAKSIVELHGGRIWAESEGEEIKFLLRLKAAKIA